MKQKAETTFQQVRMYLNGRQLQMEPIELPIDFQCPVNKILHPECLSHCPEAIGRLSDDLS